MAIWSDIESAGWSSWTLDEPVDLGKMKVAHCRTTAIAALCFVAASASTALAANYDVTKSDRIALELAPPNNISSLIDGSFADTAAFAGTFVMSGRPLATVFEDLSTPLESRIFLRNRMDTIQFESLNNFPLGANAPVPEPSSLITAIACGCGVLFGLQRLRRRRS
jgi:hypothetical protein